MGTSNNKDLEENKEAYSAFLIQIKIMLNSFPIWEKTFNIEITFKEIYEDFISDNKYEKNFSIKWNYNNKNIEFDSTKLKQFLDENSISYFTTLEINQEILEIDEKKNIIEPLDYIAIPSYNPFSILIYNIKQNTTKIKKFEENIIFNNNQIRFGIESSYCNGGNHFFIYGGINVSTREELGILLDIDLINENINFQNNISPPKRNHSLLYNNKKVYIIGGNDKKAMFYDLEDQLIGNMGELNIKRFEPSLIIHSNYLFCFDGTRRIGEKCSFEKIKLEQKDSTWEIIYPNISPILGDNVYNQKFFGIVEDNKYNIIFLGGLYADASEEINETNTNFNIKYNLVNNTMEKSDILFQEINFIEKSFLSLDENISINLFNSNQGKPLFIKFFKNNNNIEISDLIVSKIDEVPKINNNNINNAKYLYFSNISLIGAYFDMPGTKVKNPVINFKKSNKVIMEEELNNNGKENSKIMDKNNIKENIEEIITNNNLYKIEKIELDKKENDLELNKNDNDLQENINILNKEDNVRKKNNNIFIKNNKDINESYEENKINNNIKNNIELNKKGNDIKENNDKNNKNITVDNNEERKENLNHINIVNISNNESITKDKIEDKLYLKNEKIINNSDNPINEKTLDVAPINGDKINNNIKYENKDNNEEKIIVKKDLNDRQKNDNDANIIEQKDVNSNNNNSANNNLLTPLNLINNTKENKFNYISKKYIKKKQREIMKNNITELEDENY